MGARESAIFAFQFVKSILQTIAHPIKYTILGIQFWYVKCTTVTGGHSHSTYAKKSAKLYSTSHLVRNRTHLVWPSFMHTYFLYIHPPSWSISISITLLLKYNLSNSCNKIRKIEMNLLMVYTGKMRSSGKYEIWEEGVLCNVDRNHRRFVVVIDHFRNVKGI